jgi:hypothetical protein
MTDNNGLPSRRAFTGGIALVAMSAALPVFAQQGPKITIYKNPSCDCCQKWAEHLAAAGFATELINRGGITALKTEWGVPAALHSCHTGKIDGYVIEGHVPAVAIKRLLSERPQAIGLAVPGMPIGSPGMEGGEPETYEVVLFDKDGQKPFARFRGAEQLG